MYRAKKKKRGTLFSISEDSSESPTDQENSLADRVSGRRVVRSGAHRASSIFDRGSGNSGDVICEEFTFECKQTKNKSIGIKVEYLNRLSNDAIGNNKRPALHLEFTKAQSHCEKKWVLVEESMFLEMLKCLRKKSN